MSETDPVRRQLPAPRGDEGELLRRYGSRLGRAVARLAPWAPAWIVEEACGHAWEQLVRHQPDRPRVFGWLRVVAYHELLRLNGKKVNERSLEAELSSPDGRSGDAGTLAKVPGLADPHDTESAIEAREALRALAGLRWRRRRVLVLRVAGYSYQEIARMLGVSYTNVNRHVREGRAELRERRDAA